MDDYGASLAHHLCRCTIQSTLDSILIRNVDPLGRPRWLVPRSLP